MDTARHKTFFGLPTLVTRIPISKLYDAFSMLSFPTFLCSSNAFERLLHWSFT